MLLDCTTEKDVSSPSALPYYSIQPVTFHCWAVLLDCWTVDLFLHVGDGNICHISIDIRQPAVELSCGLICDPCYMEKEAYAQ